MPTPFKIVHSPGLTLVLFEEFLHFQQVFTDGRGFPEDMQPAWMGYSIGRWERDEFVIETKGLNERAVLGAGAAITHHRDPSPHGTIPASELWLAGAACHGR